MLVSIRRSLEKGREPYQIVSQLNVLNEPADLFFSLTESPWIRAGRQYAIRVSAAANRWNPSLISVATRIFGVIQTMVRLSETLLYIMSLPMASLRCYSRMPGMSQVERSHLVLGLNGAWAKMADELIMTESMKNDLYMNKLDD